MPPRPGSATRAKKAIMLVNMRVDPASRSRASAAYARYARRDAGAASTHRSTTYVSGLSARRSRKPQRKADESGRGPAVHRAAAVRCPECDAGLPGKMTDYFEMCGIYYCSTACVKAARLANV